MLKNIIKSAFCAATFFSAITSANAKIKYNVGIGAGIGLFELNGNRDDSTFKGDTTLSDLNLGAGAAIATGLNGSSPALRTTYKYVDNQPQKTLFIDAGFSKSMEHINMLDRNFFWGGFASFGWNKFNNATGLTNINGKYSNAGSTGLFTSINSKFGLENSHSKIFGIVGLTWARTDLPFDILPLGNTTKLGDLATCTVFAPGSSLIQSVEDSILNGVPITAIETLAIQNACNQIKVNKAQYDTFFVNLGTGLETKLSEKLNLFIEYNYFLQLDKGRTHKVDYTANGVKGTFKGKIVTTNTQNVKAGVRYYFN